MRTIIDFVTLTHSPTYMRAEANLCWHVMTDVWRLEPSAKKRVALCGRSIPSRWTAEVVDDGTVPEPVCATCVRAARARS